MSLPRKLAVLAASAALVPLLTAARGGAAPKAQGAPSNATSNPIDHVVVLMQENRSFDHYYGTMAGVRGYGDRTALRLPLGQDVFHQPDLLRADRKQGKCENSAAEKYAEIDWGGKKPA